MAILTTVASALALLAPQNPSPPQPGNPFVQAGAFPQETKILLSWNGTANAPWERALAALPAELARRVPLIVGSLASQAGLTPDDLGRLRHARVALGIVDLQPPDEIEWLAAVDCGAGTDELVRALQRLTGDDAPTDRRVWTIGVPPAPPVSIGRHGDVLLFGNGEAAIDAALGRLERVPGRTASIVDSIRFQRFLAQCGEERSSRTAFAAAYVDLTALLDTATALVPEAQRVQVESVVDALQLRQIFAAGYIAHDVDRKVHEHFRICFPKPRKGLPALFATTSGRIDAGLARFVPSDVPSMSVFHLDTNRLLDEVMVFASTFDASVATQIRSGLRAFSQRMSVDIERDVLGALGTRMMLLQWPSTDTFDGVLVASLVDPLKFANALRTTRQFRTNVVDDFEIFRHQSGAFTVAIGEDNAVLGASETRLQTVLDRAASSAPAPAEIAKLLSTATKSTAALSWTDTTRMLEGVLGTLEPMLPSNVVSSDVRRHVDALLPAFGTFVSNMTVDEEGISVRNDSPLGSLGMGAAIAMTAGAIAAEELDPSIASAAPSRRAEFAWRLGEIAHAMVEVGTLDLRELADKDAVPAGMLGTATGTGELVVDGYRIAVLFDERTPERFALVAWPDELRRGDVFACTESCVPMVNEILTHAAGIERPTGRDLFLGGDFRARTTPGWNAIALAATGAAGEASIELSGRDWVSYQAIVAAESGDLQLERAQMIDYLRAEHPAIVGRAAHAVAALGYRDAIPLLCERATELLDETTRRQVVQAIVDLDDPRSIETMRQMLADPDPMIRTLAAKTAGAFADSHAVEGLLDVIVRKDPAPDDQDRVQAFLSLADIGDPSCLSEASACPVAGTAQQQALTYMFQELSPKLGPEQEVATLMSVLDHDAPMLRRYAIQRLGELRDPNSVTALEHRLGAETDQLRPLVEVSIAAVRGKMTPATPPGESGAVGLLANASRWFRGLDRTTRNSAIAGGIGAVMLFAGLGFVLLRRRRHGSDVDWAAMTAPSEAESGDEAWAATAEPTRYDDEYDAPPLEVDIPYDEATEAVDQLDPGFYGDDFDFAEDTGELEEEFPQRRK